MLRDKSTAQSLATPTSVANLAKLKFPQVAKAAMEVIQAIKKPGLN